MIRSRGRTQPIPPHERRVRGTCPQVRLIARQALANIVTQCGSGGQRAWAAFRHPESWELVTQHSWREIAYVVTWDIIAVGTMIWALFGSSVPGVSDWARFVTMAVCATVYLVFTRRYEESRRSRAVGPHIDVTSVWTFAGLVVLPTPLALGLILIIRGQRWFAARRPLYRFIFSTCNMVTAALLTKLVFQSVGGMVGASGSGTSVLALGWVGSLRDLTVLGSGGAVYLGLPALIIAGAVLLRTPRSMPTVREMFGSRFDNGLEVLSMLVGIVTALLMAYLPVAVVLMIPVSVLINRAGEIQKLLRDARTDPKTGLMNMRGWQEAAHKEFARADRSGNPLALFMVDLDHFKSINDTWGHPAGDDMLIAVSKVLRSETRPTDLVGRFGGEEFVVLLPDTNAEEAVAAAERIRARIAGLAVPTTDKRGRPVVIGDRTTSIGVSSRPMHALTLDPLLQAADAAVYVAKETGRNQVRLAEVGDIALAEELADELAEDLVGQLAEPAPAPVEPMPRTGARSRAKSTVKPQVEPQLV